MSLAAEFATTKEDIRGITETSRDYVEGWYTGDVERMRGALHPDLAKRTLARDPQNNTWSLTRRVNAKMMVTFTEEGGGSDVGKPGLKFDISILDVFRHIASVKVLSYEYMDYLHLAKINDRWQIINVLWELKEGELEPKT